MMRYCNRLTTMFSAHFVKPFVPQIPCRHLYTNMERVRVRMCVKIRYFYLHAHLPAKLSYKSLITVALFATEVKITMRRYTSIAGTKQHIQQSHAVRSAAYGNQHRLVFVQQTPLANICTDAP